MRQLSEIVAGLPSHLSERTRSVRDVSQTAPGEFILYWLHHGMRAQENPALDVGLAISNLLRLPLLVYQSLPERYPFASDRHHTFILEGVRDLQQQFRARGIRYVFNLERRDHRGPQLPELHDRAAVTVTEEMPVEPLRGWIERLAASNERPLLCVDSSCVVPMQTVGSAYERAFEYRRAFQSLYDQRVPRRWRDIEPRVAAGELDFPFSPLDLSAEDLASLVAACEIDHAIGPVPHTPGGSAAGYARWEQFCRSGLESYARLRNNPLIDATSRLSAYLHYGMISPLRVAREAAQPRTPGGEKFLDELLIWRELAYVFCFYRRDHETITALPAWAQETLGEHEADPRPAIHSWETLARGRTGDRLWDAAQRSLLMHGELHNNVRMTWGKALLNWTPDARAALSLMIDLNHRYALDGRDPASYGGILWCLGQFDRPFPPARQICGTLRRRPTAEHAERLDPAEYLQHSTRPLHQPRPRVAIIGAGISGLMCARTLQDHGLRVTVFEKSRGAGGRMATRRTTEGPQFDHGAQYFTVRDPRFGRYVESWLQDGIVAPWGGEIVELQDGEVKPKSAATARFVAVPGMNAICKHLAADLEVHFRKRVAPPRFDQAAWHLEDDAGQLLGEFDYVITSAPAPQAAELLVSAPELQHRARATSMNGCWAAMISLAEPLELPYSGAFVQQSVLSWIARNDTKPGRSDASNQRQGDPECWVLHASPDWTEQHLEEDDQSVLRILLTAWWRATGAKSRSLVTAQVHRWRYAIPVEPLADRCLFDAEQGIGACGDWCSGPRVEGAFLSGMAMAGSVLAHAARCRTRPLAS